jgi:hypothetical protein
MKNNYLICFCAVMLAVCQTCKKDEDTPALAEPYLPADPTEITLRATIALADSRKENAALSTDFQWAEADSVGIFMKRNESFRSERYALLPSSLSSDRRDALFTGALRWEKNALQHNFYAYYPKAAGAADATQIPVTIPAVQEQSGGSSSHLARYSTLVASPAVVTAPRDITDVGQNKSVNMDFISAFATIEFRFASYKEEGLQISKVTLASDNGDLAVTNGMLDLTNPDFSSGFAMISGGAKSASVSLNITNPPTVPVSERYMLIPNNDASKPANPEIVFPASLTVLPNINAVPNDPSREEKWTISLETSMGSFTQAIPRRRMKPGEKYIIEHVVITSDTTGLNLTPPVDNTPGAPWDGATVAPQASQIDNAAKKVTIKHPGELAWLAQIVNCVRSPELGVDTFFRSYTVVLDNNIHLGDREWTPIGNTIGSGKEYIFQGTFDGQGHMISNFKITSSGNAAYVYAGLFGCSGAQAIRNLRVEGATINLQVLTSASLAYVGGIVAYAPASHPANISSCSFDGTIDVNYSTHAWSVGGICGYALGGGSITSCSSSARIAGINAIANSARADIGGIAGYAAGTRIKDCLFTGEVEGNGQWNAGGIAGNATGAIVASKNTGSIMCNGRQVVIGGVVGLGRCDVISCYNTGTVNASGGAGIYDYKGVGGVAGSLSMGGMGLGGKTLKGCYSTGAVTRATALGNRTGNVVGWYEPLTASLPFNYDKISNNYYSPRGMTADSPTNIGVNRITQFSAGAWPATSMDGWGVGDGSGDNKYWNPDFPTSFGSSYPVLHWEVVR